MRAPRVIAVAVLLLALASPFAGGASAESPGVIDEFAAANLLYENENYEAAALSYERLVGLGYEDATLYYNLANAYYRSEDTGRAILNYLRASRLAPFDEDIRANLELARRQMENANPPRASVPQLARIADLAPWLSLNQAALLALLAWAAIGALAFAWLWKTGWRNSRLLRGALAAAVVALVAFGGMAVGKEMSANGWERIAVVTHESAEAFSGPAALREGDFGFSLESRQRGQRRREARRVDGHRDSGIRPERLGGVLRRRKASWSGAGSGSTWRTTAFRRAAANIENQRPRPFL